MIPQSCLLIETKKFPIMPGEDQEIVNERMYGKALCQYLESMLPGAGLKVPSYWDEDWGWWLEVERGAFKMGLCIYSDPEAKLNPERYAILPSVQKAKKWSWSKFKNVDNSADVLALVAMGILRDRPRYFDSLGRSKCLTGVLHATPRPPRAAECPTSPHPARQQPPSLFLRR